MSDTLAGPEASGPYPDPVGPRAGLFGSPVPAAGGTRGSAEMGGEHGPTAENGSASGSSPVAGGGSGVRSGQADEDSVAGGGPEGEEAYDPAAPAPLGVVRTPTGRPEVDAQLERLGDADHLATDGHLEVYEDVHRGLRDALTALDARPGPPAPPSSSVHRS